MADTIHPTARVRQHDGRRAARSATFELNALVPCADGPVRAVRLRAGDRVRLGQTLRTIHWVSVGAEVLVQFSHPVRAREALPCVGRVSSETGRLELTHTMPGHPYAMTLR